MTVQELRSAQFRPVAFPPVDLSIERRPDGTILLTPNAALPKHELIVADALVARAAQHPERMALAERDLNGAWAEIKFGALIEQVNSAAQWLLDNGAGPSTPIMSISGNSIAHAVIRYAALSIGAPIAPVSEGYAILGVADDYARLRHAIDLVEPAFIFAESAPSLAAARACAEGLSIITGDDIAGEGSVPFGDLLRVAPRGVEAARAAIDPDAPAGYMLTSGSTGKPKAVTHTNRSIATVVAQACWTIEPTGLWGKPVLEWLPWSHVSGQYVSVAQTLSGTPIYIDKGKPLPGLFDETIRNIRDLSLTAFTNVPVGYAMLVEALEKDQALRECFFKDMRLMLFGGAALPQPVYDRLQKMAMETVGARIMVTCGYGATETTAGCLSAYYITETPGIGLPLPGVTVKMIPFEDRYELRLKGDMITPGYLKRDDLRAEMFDEEGFYRTGDTGLFIDPDAPEQGLRFHGRLSEEFKLDTGTWVAAGALRTDLLKALGPQVSELLVCGENKDGIGILAWGAAGASLEEIAEKIKGFNADNPGLSRRVKRFGFLSTPPDIASGEVSDKGSINQRLAIGRRKEAVDHLYASPTPEDVLSF